MKIFWITGTDTHVGKTRVCQHLVQMGLILGRSVAYWKPVETGIEDWDSQTLKKSFPPPQSSSHFHLLPPTYSLKAPLAPHLAAEQEGKVLCPNTLSQHFEQHCQNLSPHTTLLIEGAGGPFVPLVLPHFYFIHWAQTLSLPTLLVTEDRLGAMHQTLVNLYALHQQGLSLKGIILNKALPEDPFGNQKTLAQCLPPNIPLYRFPQRPFTPTASSPQKHQKTSITEDPLSWLGLEGEAASVAHQ